LGNLVVVTGKIPRELKEKAKKLGININRVIRKAIEDAVKEREKIVLKESLNSCAKILEKIDLERLTESIREDRDRR